jgi:hypothetical protein
MFHARDDYVRPQAQQFKLRKRMADRQNPGTIERRPEPPFLQLLIHICEKLQHSVDFIYCWARC